MIRALARILRHKPLTPRQQAQRRLEQIVEATRHSYGAKRHRAHRAAAMKGRVA